MLKILLTGCAGRMGRAVTEAARESGRAQIVAGVDVSENTQNIPFPVYPSVFDFSGGADVIVDFSHHSLTRELLEYAVKRRLPLVIATTGHTAEEALAIRRAGEFIPVFYSRNMSLGINLLLQLAKTAAAMLGEDWDIEIIEKHHNKKLDAPSGTALMIASALEESLSYKPRYVYDRHHERREREKTEIGIHAIRGGTIVGEHEVIFAGKDELVTLSHSAASREVFAYGALRAAEYMKGRAPGSYSMSDLVAHTVAAK